MTSHCCKIRYMSWRALFCWDGGGERMDELRWKRKEKIKRIKMKRGRRKRPEMEKEKKRRGGKNKMKKRVRWNKR